MTQYKRRVDICNYPHPAASEVARDMSIKREHDTLIFNTPSDKREFDRRVRDTYDTSPARN